jgi:hypothetical protein
MENGKECPLSSPSRHALADDTGGIGVRVWVMLVVACHVFCGVTNEVGLGPETAQAEQVHKGQSFLASEFATKKQRQIKLTQPMAG